jgi:hypothetical protein
MTDRKMAARLATLADLVLQDRLVRLRTAAAAREQTAAQIAALAEAPAEGLAPLVAAQQSLRYQRWADARRLELNLVLARQTAVWMTAQGAATVAFGRAQVIDKLVLQKKP